MRDRFTKKRGIAMLITAIGLVMITFIVGLAVDAALLYLVKAKLSSSCDAAALAAARSLNVGLTLAAQEASARARANAFFLANFPAGTMNSKNLGLQVTVAESGLRTRTVEVRATVDAPTYFMRMAGYDKVPVMALGTASRRDVNLILVLDRSSSMNASGSCTPMKNAAKAFVANFAEGRDRLGMIVFGASWYLGFAPSKNFKTASPTLEAQINSISCYGNTSSAMAISEAYNQIVQINEPGALNLILFFTDGLPNGVTASFPVKTQSDSRYGDGSSTYPKANTQYTFPKSTCYDAAGRTNANAAWNPQNRVGVLAQWSGFAATGTTAGLMAPYAASINAGSEPSINGPVNSDTSRQGCNFGPGTTNLSWVRRDIAYIPQTDVYGNGTVCCYKTVETFPSGPYTGQIRPDKPSSIGKAAANATANAAQRIRRDTTYAPVFYVIGLGDPTGVEPPDEVLLANIANDPTSASYDRTETTGLYVFAPNNTQLNQAFSRIASEILRLSR